MDVCVTLVCMFKLVSVSVSVSAGISLCLHCDTFSLVPIIVTHTFSLIPIIVTRFLSCTYYCVN